MDCHTDNSEPVDDSLVTVIGCLGEFLEADSVTSLEVLPPQPIKEGNNLNPIFSFSSNCRRSTSGLSKDKKRTSRNDRARETSKKRKTKIHIRGTPKKRCGEEIHGLAPVNDMPTIPSLPNTTASSVVIATTGRTTTVFSGVHQTSVLERRRRISSRPMYNTQLKKVWRRRIFGIGKGKRKAQCDPMSFSNTFEETGQDPLLLAKFHQKRWKGNWTSNMDFNNVTWWFDVHVDLGSVRAAPT